LHKRRKGADRDPYYRRRNEEGRGGGSAPKKAGSPEEGHSGTRGSGKKNGGSVRKDPDLSIIYKPPGCRKVGRTESARRSLSIMTGAEVRRKKKGFEKN